MPVERCLATAVGAADEQELPILNGEVDASQRMRAIGIGVTESFDRNH